MKRAYSSPVTITPCAPKQACPEYCVPKCTKAVNAGNLKGE
jgi:hypothetical protein